MATPDNGLCAAIYSASEVSAKVGDKLPSPSGRGRAPTRSGGRGEGGLIPSPSGRGAGGEGGGTLVTISEDTHYPFEETLRFAVKPEKPVEFPLYFRIPAWCARARLSVNGQPAGVAVPQGGFARIDRRWRDGDAVVLELPMRLSVRAWEKNHDSVSVDYGPLTFSLKIAQRLVRVDSAKTAIGDSRWQKGADTSLWPSWEILPDSPWNYGLALDAQKPAGSFKIEKRPWPASDFPFTLDEVPLALSASARKIPQWTLDRYGLVAPLQDSPAASDQPLETVSLVPMGAARLRISAFPAIGDPKTAHRWTAPTTNHAAGK
jgi:hypothetical protein